MKPEKQVEKEVLDWLLQNGFSVDVYDSKAIFSETAQRYKKSKAMKEGTSDLLGVSPQGFFVALELKSPKKEATCTLDQRNFLQDKIEKNGFGLLVSSVSFLQETWSSWIELRNQGKIDAARNFMLSRLPIRITIENRIVTICSHQGN